jgi:hypothetical protein
MFHCQGGANLPAAPKTGRCPSQVEQVCLQFLGASRRVVLLSAFTSWRASLTMPSCSKSSGPWPAVVFQLHYGCASCFVPFRYPRVTEATKRRKRTCSLGGATVYWNVAVWWHMAIRDALGCGRVLPSDQIVGLRARRATLRDAGESDNINLESQPIWVLTYLIGKCSSCFA